MKTLLLTIITIALFGFANFGHSEQIKAQSEQIKAQLMQGHSELAIDQKPKVKQEQLDRAMDVIEIIDWLMENPPADVDDSELWNLPGASCIQRSVEREVDVSKLNFPWRWDRHYLAVLYVKTKTGISVEPNIYLDLREYKAAVSTGYKCRFIHFNTVIDVDGKMATGWRIFKLLTKDDTFVSPIYPPGFLNPEWRNVPESEQKAIIDKELEFWLEIIRNPKKAV